MSVTGAVDAAAVVPAARRLTGTSIVFWVLFVAGLGARLVWMLTNAVILDSDRGVVYLMATEVAQGRIPLVFWGQDYGGSVLPLVAGAIMLVTGPHLEVLTAVGILFFAGAALLIRSIAARAVGRSAGDVAGVAFWFPGYALFYLTLGDPGFCGPTLVFALGAILVSTLPVDRTRRYPIWLGTGLLVGLAIWQSPMGAALAAPALVALLVRDRSWLGALLAIAGVVVGVTPWLAQLLVVRASLEPLEERAQFIPRSLMTFFTELMAYAVTGQYDTAAAIVGATVVAGLIALLLVVAIVGRNLVLGVLVAGAVLCYAVVVLGAGDVLHRDSYRYAVFFVPALAVALGWLFTRLRPLAFVGLLLLPAITVTQAVVQPPGLEFTTRYRFGLGAPELAEALDGMGASAVFADYWIAYSLAADTDGRIAADPLSFSRHRPYREAALAADRTVLVVYENAPNDIRLSTDPALPPSTRTTAGGYAIHSFDAPFDPTGIAWDMF